ncbi:MAG: COP23 domain-containing protein [Xenococcaceae cyanobacterium MO_167.B27]|nr:COP23 domain-containing protein [Xenococcaceae cyanobacterium MO_167.B27]
MMSHKFNPLKSSIATATLPLTMASLVLGANSVNAAPFPSELSLNSNNFGQALVVSQNNSQPPEVIIDPNPGTNPNPSTTVTKGNSDTRFGCEYVNGEYTVMYYPESQPRRSYPWAVPGQLGGGWSPQRRCNEITRRLESYREDGLIEMSTGWENGYDTICVTTLADPTDCRIVLTVPPGQDPQLTRDLIFENLLVADDGQQTQGIYTFGETGSSNNILNDIGQLLGGNKAPSRNSGSPNHIDLRPFLDPADGGTGTQLKRSQSRRVRSINNSNSPEKPAIFR